MEESYAGWTNRTYRTTTCRSGTNFLWYSLKNKRLRLKFLLFHFAGGEGNRIKIWDFGVGKRGIEVAKTPGRNKNTRFQTANKPVKPVHRTLQLTSHILNMAAQIRKTF